MRKLLVGMLALVIPAVALAIHYTDQLWITDGIIAFKERADTPAAASGWGKLYQKDDGNLYHLSPLGVETILPTMATYNLNGLTDVTLTSPADGEFLRYDTGTTQWLNTTAALDDLSDMTIATPTAGQLLRYNGSNWENSSEVVPASGAAFAFYPDDSASDLGGIYNNLYTFPSGGAEDTDSITVNSGTSPVELDHRYVSATSLGVTEIPAGVWDFFAYAYVSAAAGVTQMRLTVFVYEEDTTVTDLFTVDFPEINNSSVELLEYKSIQEAFTVNATDRLGIKVFALTTTAANKTLYFTHNGTENYSYFTTPLGASHNNLAGLQGGQSDEYFHLTSAQYSGLLTGAGTATYIPYYLAANAIGNEAAFNYNASTDTLSAVNVSSTAVTASTSVTTGSILVSGSTSGTATIQTPAVAGTPTVTLPTVNTTMPTALPTSDGQVLVATTAGVQSYADRPNPNYIINGNFDYWQRGTSLAAATTTYNSVFLADRFKIQGSNTYSTHSQGVFYTTGQSAVPNNPKYYYSTTLTANGAGADSQYSIISYYAENVGTLAGKTVTLSFWAKTDANQKIALNVLQYFGPGGHANVFTTPSSITTTTSWAKYSITFAVPSIDGFTVGTDGTDFISFNFYFNCGSDYSANCDSIGRQYGTFDIAQIKLEEGSVATPFVRAGGTLAGELVACQRYYEIGYKRFVARSSDTSERLYTEYKVTKRVAAIADVYNDITSTVDQIYNTTTASALAADTTNLSDSGFTMYPTANTTSGNSYTFVWTASAEF